MLAEPGQAGLARHGLLRIGYSVLQIEYHARRTRSESLVKPFRTVARAKEKGGWKVVHGMQKMNLVGLVGGERNDHASGTALAAGGQRVDSRRSMEVKR